MSTFSGIIDSTDDTEQPTAPSVKKWKSALLADLSDSTDGEDVVRAHPVASCEVLTTWIQFAVLPFHTLANTSAGNSVASSSESTKVHNITVYFFDEVSNRDLTVSQVLTHPFREPLKIVSRFAWHSTISVPPTLWQSSEICVIAARGQ